jgi:hypothetical protein
LLFDAACTDKLVLDVSISFFPVKLLQPVKGNKKVNFSQRLYFVSCYNFAMQASCIQEVMNRKEVLCVPIRAEEQMKRRLEDATFGRALLLCLFVI